MIAGKTVKRQGVRWRVEAGFDVDALAELVEASPERLIKTDRTTRVYTNTLRGADRDVSDGFDG